MSTNPVSLSSPEANLLLQRRLSGEHSRYGVVASDGESRKPLSSDQRRLWFLGEANGGGAEYNVDAAYRLRGHLAVDAFAEALRLVVTRHQALRSRIVIIDREPFQVVDDPTTVLLSRHDLSDRPDPAAAAVDLARHEAGYRFDLTRVPPLRAWLARLGHDDHAFGVTVHHLAFDRESLEILKSELSAAYAAITRGLAPELTPLLAQFGDFAAWERRHADQGGRASDLSYWRERVGNVPAALQLPTDRERPARPSHVAGEIAVRVPDDVADRVRALAAAHRTTSFVPALAGFQALLLRYAPGTRAVAVGCPFNARTRVEFEPLIGFFVRSLPIVADLSDAHDPDFDQLVIACREAMLGAHEHQELPLNEIVRVAGAPRDLRHNPIFQVWFDLAADGSAGARDWLAGLDVRPLRTGSVRTRFDLEMHLTDPGTGPMAGRLLYATELFDAATAKEIVQHYQHLLGEAVREPGVRLSRIALLSEEERDEIVNQWSVGAKGVTS
ncbi:condensation domain-containing protein [Micromonospora sp. DT4]|uniref:condensation domain-containing protein n=1 Tax=Micromonospora sp. DT4 TaxID=3393438 RepID=UPI003CEAB35A